MPRRLSPFCHDLAGHHALLIFCTNALLFFKMLTNKCAHCQWSPFPNGGSELDMLHRHIELLNDRIATEQKQTFFHLWCWLDADALDSGDAHLWAHLCKGCKHRFRLLCSNTKRWCWNMEMAFRQLFLRSFNFKGKQTKDFVDSAPQIDRL